MSITTSNVIDRFGDHLAATLPSSPVAERWTRSRFLPPSLGQDTEAKLSRCWSVWSPSGTKIDPRERQKLSEGSVFDSTIEVGFSYALRQDAQAADYTAALAAEDVLIRATLSVNRVDLPRVLLTGIRRDTQGDGRTLVTILTLQVAHTIPLQ